MILGIGTDILENKRIRRMYKRFGRRFLKRIYTEEEILYAESHEDPVPYLAARFAVKEALIKALNLKGREVKLKLREVEVAGKVFGKKNLVLTGRAKELVDTMGANKYHLSLSHSRFFSMAVVILEKVDI